ncbi:MAG TPA: hypothetical protein GX711_01130 [Clostridia bacterium]|nr:hypothetical protein [Clostridia bacterium]
MSLELAFSDERKTMAGCIKELEKGIEELAEAYQKKNIPQVGAALCDVEYHVQELLKMLEAQQPFFQADDFRKYVRRKHTSQAV